MMKMAGLVCYVFVLLGLFGGTLFHAYLGEWDAATFYLIFTIAFDHYIR